MPMPPQLVFVLVALPYHAAALPFVVVDAGVAAPVNGVSRHSDQLMGITAYSQGQDFTKPATQLLVKQLGIKSIGLQAMVINFAPPGLTASQLTQWFATPTNGSESAALKYLRNRSPSYVELLQSRGIHKAGAVQWTYLKAGDGTTCNGTAAEGHCLSAGTPSPNASGSWGWWEALFVGAFRTLRSLDTSLRFVHIWNEPNAHFWHDKKDGTWYADMYVAVAKALKAEFPTVLLGGPVTFSPPFHQVKGERPGVIDGSLWNDYFEPLLERTKGLGLLDWIDFHAYQFLGTMDASGDVLEQNMQKIASRASLRAAITETNFPLEPNASWATRWTKRALGLAAQTMAMLRNPDKILTRQVFDWGVPPGDSKGNKGAYRFLPDEDGGSWTPEMEVYSAFRNFSGALRVKAVQPASRFVEAEAVCVGSSVSTACGHLKVALVNTGADDAAYTVQLKSMAILCTKSSASVVRLGPSTPGAQMSQTSCMAPSVVVPAQGMVVVECACNHKDDLVV